MNYIAIDFETANEKRNSPCSIGIVAVKDGLIVEKIHQYIKPKEMRFMPINIGIHGIRPGMVENEPEFHKVWERIKPYFSDNLVIAHNASFDISVLRKTAELYGIILPSFQFICTMKLARNFYPGIENAKLNTVNRFLQYEFLHHDALYDALACSNILNHICEELQCDDMNEISRLTGVTIGMVNENSYTPSTIKSRALKTSHKPSPPTEPPAWENMQKNTYQNEVVVFTGRLQSLSREEAMLLVRKLGGTCGSSVTKKTTLLVTNMKNIQNLCREEMSTKYKRALDLTAKGQAIRILNEEEFLMQMPT